MAKNYFRQWRISNPSINCKAFLFEVSTVFVVLEILYPRVHEFATHVDLFANTALFHPALRLLYRTFLLADVDRADNGARCSFRN